MLAFTETAGGFKFDQALTDRFNASTTEAAYEKKITGLIKNSYKNDIERDDGMRQIYAKAFQVLKRGDHYILIMLGNVLEGNSSRSWVADKLLLIATGIAFLLIPVLVYIQIDPSGKWMSLMNGSVAYLTFFFMYSLFMERDERDTKFAKFKIVLFQLVIATVLISIYIVLLKFNIIKIEDHTRDEKTLGIIVFFSLLGFSVLILDFWRKQGILFDIITDYVEKFRAKKNQ
jgi:hypothetical protein